MFITRSGDIDKARAMEVAGRESRGGRTYIGDADQRVFGGLRRGFFGGRQGSWWTFRYVMFSGFVVLGLDTTRKFGHFWNHINYV
jgi:hypothetical protein